MHFSYSSIKHLRLFITKTYFLMFAHATNASLGRVYNMHVHVKYFAALQGLQNIFTCMYIRMYVGKTSFNENTRKSKYIQVCMCTIPTYIRTCN